MCSKIAERAMIVLARRQTLLQPTRSPRFCNDVLGRCFASVSTPPPPSKGGNEVGEKAKETMDNVLDATKERSQKVKERVMGAERPSKNPDLNHGVESTDSSCEDVRDRPGGYS
ncbi:hypothetical protein R6Q57_025884 [Mikania cordata]